MITTPHAMSNPPTSSASTPSSGGTLVCSDGRALPLRATELRGRLCGGFGRVTLSQRFVNPHAEPLRVTYQVPLPSDGAVAGFRFQIGDEEIVGEVDRTARARERFEEAIVHGRTAALLEQDRSSLFTQEVGNIPPGSEVVVTLEIDQKLQWLPDADAGLGGWEWRFPTVVAPRFLGAAGRVADSQRIAVDVADAPRPITTALHLCIAEPLAEGGRLRSPSHGLAVTSAAGVHDVAFADTQAGLDRDVVVRWPVVTAQVGIGLDAARPAAGHPRSACGYGLLTLVPPSRATRVIARDLVVLLDTSGSMHGDPLAQAQHVTSALVQSLGDDDTLELIEFSNAPRRWSRGAVAMTDREKAKALKWIAGLSASGGTEMRTGILEALAGLRDEAQRQVVVITDGLIGFEEEVVGEIMRRLPAGSRVHTIGVGSAVNRSLTGPAARAGRGVEVIVGIGEDAERAASRVLAHTRAPLVVDLRLEGDALQGHAPARLPDLFAGAPALVAAELRPQGGELVLRGRTEDGPFSARVHVPTLQPGDGSPSLASLFARERVEDLELRRAAGDGSVDEAIEALGLDYRIATRLTSWIAVSRHATVDPRDPARRETIPQELPFGMSIEGLGLRAVGGPMGATQQAVMRTQTFAIAAAPAMPAASPASMGTRARKGGGVLRRMISALGGEGRGEAKPTTPSAAPPLSRPSMAPPPPHLDEGLLADEETAGPASTREAAADLELRGRVVLRDDGRFVIEIVLPRAAHWDPEPTLELELADGRTLIVELDADACTRPGPTAAGASVRLVFAVPDTADTPRRIRLSSHGRAWQITL